MGIKDEYENGECPDCGDPIPEDAHCGGECANCGHVWWESCPKCGNTLDDKLNCPECDL